MWEAGDKAVCVEKFLGVSCDSNCPNHNIKPSGLPAVNTIYLVDRVSVDTEALIIAGLPCYNRMSGKEAGWVNRKFRKLISRSEREAITEENVIEKIG